MNIVFVTHYQDLYGANKSLCNLLTNLDKKKYNILVICPDKGEMTDYLNSKNIPNISGLFFRGWEYSGTSDLIRFPYRFLRSVLTMLFILPRLRKFKPDIVYSNSSVIWFGKAISVLLRKPHVWHVREFGLKDYGLKMIGGKSLSMKLMNSSAAVIAISKAIEDEVIRGVNTGIRHQIYNGVVPEREICVAPGKPEGFTFCMAGLLIPSKGYEEALHAMKLVIDKFPNAKLLIAGKGSLYDTYEAYLHGITKKLGLSENVCFAGYVKDMKSVYSQSHCLLMCSKAEGLGRVTIEAMAAGLPVIGHRSGATPEIINHKINGYLYEGRSDELASYMMEMMEDAQYDFMSKQAMATVREKFTIEGYLEKMDALLQKVSVKKL